MTSQPLLPLDSLRREWIDHAASQILHLFRGKEFSSDDVHEIIGDPPERNWMGACIAQLRNKGKITHIRYKTSARREANCRPVSVWRVA